MIEIQAPNKTDIENFPKVFLGGSIEMGKATPWQQKLCTELKDEPCIMVNPRRTDWDSSWAQDPSTGTQFHEQVTWELWNLEDADIRVFCFDENTTSPITLLELGLYARESESVLVYCTPKYFRYGNVKIVCDLYKINITSNWDSFVIYLQRMILEKYREK